MDVYLKTTALILTCIGLLLSIYLIIECIRTMIGIRIITKRLTYLSDAKEWFSFISKLSRLRRRSQVENHVK